jgi:hypothetical protein
MDSFGAPMTHLGPLHIICFRGCDLLALPTWGPLAVVTAIAAVHLVQSDLTEKVEP